MDKQIVELLKKFIANQCSASELKRVEELLKDGRYSEEWGAVLEESAVEHFLNPPGDELQQDFDQQLLLTRIQKSAGITPKRKQFFPLVWTAAACVLLISAVALYLNVKTANAPKAVVAAKKPVKESANHKYLKLADGSKVLLNDSSILTYPEAFSGKTREVTLTGEAFFDIRHDAKHPFIIHTGELTTTVLGTAFNIRAFKKDGTITVTVTRGKVSVQKGKNLLAILTPDQQVSYNLPAATHRKKAVDAEQIVSWKQHDLILDDVTLEEAATLIGKQYGKKIHFASQEVKGCRFSASFLNRSTLEQVLSVVGQITNTTIELNNDVIEIDGRGCQ